MRVSVCHCTFCQRRTGSAFAILAVFKEDQVELRGDTISVFEHRSDESNLSLRLEFCNRCSTTVAVRLERFPGARGIFVGTFDNPNWVKIERHIWTRSAQHWVVFPENMERFEKSTPQAPTPG
jgi:hypothetical protein